MSTASKRPVRKKIRITDNPDDIKIEEPKKWFPENFHEIYDNIKIMRTWVKAPVDTMEGNIDDRLDGPDERFLILFSLMISSRTRDTLNISVMKRMKENGLNLQYVLDIPENKLAEQIKPVNFYKTKAKNLKKSALMLVEKFNGDIPKTIEELCELPGVGPKMGYLCLQAAWDITVGIGVDTHVHRLANLFNWVRKPTKESEDTRKELESWLPIELWEELNLNLVGFGQTICNPYKPKCDECLNNKICPGAFTHKVRKSPKKSSPKK
ncbi:endonuclease III-like protein 1 [Panonychus citri]|uniref:endonuclease III-like protein 1 n=1 Tax=Panonychus citri TaxID=50023 RepID=UPI0023070A00|nr:endonuclease III-like protein 1 [Panonychus citri]